MRSAGVDLEHRRRAHAAARAHAREADAAAAAAQLVHRGDDHAGAGGGDRVTERAAGAVRVGDVLREAELAARRDRHRRERLVDLGEVDVADRQAGALERLRDRGDRAEAGVARAARPPTPTTRSWRAA